MKKANRVLSWDSTSGSIKAIIIVTDTEKNASDVDHRTIELCSLDDEDDEWKTEEKIDHIEQLREFGIPESMTN
jgi:hypothetical protein